jgi:hypothetical protein
MEKRYRALRIVAAVYRILGGILGILTILLAIGICVTSIAGGAALSRAARDFNMPFAGGMAGGIISGIVIAVLAIIYGGGFALTLFAIGEGILLFIALEENTRATVLLLQRQAKHAEGPPAAD